VVIRVWVRGLALIPIRAWARAPTPAVTRELARAPIPVVIRVRCRVLIHGWGAALTLDLALAQISGRDLIRTSGRDLIAGLGPGRILGWMHGLAPGRGRARSPRTSPARELIRGGVDRRTRRPVPAPARSSAHGHGQARSPTRLIQGRVPLVARTPIRLALRPGVPARHPLPTPCVPDRPTRGPVPAARVPVVQAGAVPVGAAPKRAVPVPPALPGRAVLVPAVLRAGAERAEGPAAEAQAGSSAGTVSPAGTAMRAAHPTRTRCPAGAGRQGLRAMADLARTSQASRLGLAGPAEPSQAAMKKPAAEPAVCRAQARRR
jgi:hypothetical protein